MSENMELPSISYHGCLSGVIRATAERQRKSKLTLRATMNEFINLCGSFEHTTKFIRPPVEFF